jgi:diguanylate cyclase (GGDEF)-like protein
LTQAARHNHAFVRGLLAAIMMLIAWVMAPGTARANAEINLRPHLCSVPPPAERAAQGRPRSSACEPVLKDRANAWTWVRLDNPRRLDPLPAGWHLLLPHRNIDSLRVVMTYRDGTEDRLARSNGALAVDWSPLGHASLRSPRPGTDVAALAIGYRSNKPGSALRYVTSVPGPVFERRASNFHLVIGLFLGTVGSALVYNLFIGAGRRHTFQRIYIVWGTLALLNGLLASGALAELWPGLSGPAGILANKLVLAALFASGTLFLLALIEDDILPSAMVRLGVATALAIGATGPLAMVEAWLPSGSVGKLTTLFTAANILVVAVVAMVAARRGSRAVWFYLAGWSPLLVFAMVLVAYEVGRVEHSQLIDLGGLLAISFESLVLSLAIADRFRRLQSQTEALERAQLAAGVDRAVLQKIANTDQLTGLGNRRVFDNAFEAAQRGEIDRLALILIDIDNFKDRLGHDGGDDILVSVAQHIRANVRAQDIVARLGGDEFAILLKGSDAHHVDRIVTELLAVQSRATPSPAGKVTFSVGAALFPDDSDDISQLYKNADLALYEAKRLGRARARRYSPVLSSRDQQRLLLS